MPDASQITRPMVEAAAEALANARAARRGAPVISNVLRILPAKIREEFLEDAEEALKAALVLREGARG